MDHRQEGVPRSRHPEEMSERGDSDTGTNFETWTSFQGTRGTANLSDQILRQDLHIAFTYFWLRMTGENAVEVVNNIEVLEDLDATANFIWLW